MSLGRTLEISCASGPAFQSRDKRAQPRLLRSAIVRPHSAVQWLDNVHRSRSCCVASLRDDLDEVQQQIQDQEAVMEACVQRDDFTSAAAARDSVTSMQLRRRSVELTMQADATTVHLKVGQVIRHQKYDYKGVIVGYDDHCSAPDSWITRMGVDKLPLGREQPFYHVLCDERDRPSSRLGPTTTYVAQENCNLLPIKVASPIENALIEHNFDGFHNGRYVPKEHLQKQYPDSAAIAASDTPADGGQNESM